MCLWTRRRRNYFPFENLTRPEVGRLETTASCLYKAIYRRNTSFFTVSPLCLVYSIIFVSLLTVDHVFYLFRFTPDFSMSRVTRKLEVKTTLGPVMEFTLVATIPTHLLPLCASSLGHNSWEPILRGAVVFLMGVVFLGVVIAAYAEARKLAFLSHPEVQLLQMKEEDRGPIFDLNAIAGVKKNKWVLLNSLYNII